MNHLLGAYNRTEKLKCCPLVADGQDSRHANARITNCPLFASCFRHLRRNRLGEHQVEPAIGLLSLDPFKQIVELLNDHRQPTHPYQTEVAPFSPSGRFFRL